MLSSFSPEVCILLSLKQDIFPMFFLNDYGDCPTGDVRFAKDKGLVTASYRASNDEPECAKVCCSQRSML
jgi:hypothetical protein